MGACRVSVLCSNVVGPLFFAWFSVLGFPFSDFKRLAGSCMKTIPFSHCDAVARGCRRFLYNGGLHQDRIGNTQRHPAGRGHMASLGGGNPHSMSLMISPLIAVSVAVFFSCLCSYVVALVASVHFEE